MTTTLRVDAGSYGLVSIVRVESRQKGRISIAIESDCAQVNVFGRHLEIISMADIFYRPFNMNTVYDKADRADLHQSCPLPCAVLKAGLLSGVW